MIGDTISFMPSSVCKTENLSIMTERPAWSKFLPKKVNQKRQQNYEKQVLKKIQEDTIEQLPKCDDFPSFKVRTNHIIFDETTYSSNYCRNIRPTPISLIPHPIDTSSNVFWPLKNLSLKWPSVNLTISLSTLYIVAYPFTFPLFRSLCSIFSDISADVVTGQAGY